MRILIALGIFFIAGFAVTLQAAEPIPSCRYDNSLIPIVSKAVEWAIDDFRANQVPLPFERVVYNKDSGNDDKVLSVHLVKDATLSTVDSQGCIEDRSFPIGSSLIKTDGDCIPTDLSNCTRDDKAYMNNRFVDIHSKFSDTQTGYELTGMCYMTNLQACMHRDRLELLNVLGERDKLSVKGTCVTSLTPKMSIHCSAGALKMLLSQEAAKELAPTVGILFVLSHELGHLSKEVSSSYDTSDYTVDRAWSREDKFARIQDQCQRGNALRGREEVADKLALMVTQKHVEEISERWPAQGTAPWLVTQTGHFSTNLVRWNNDWNDGELADVPDVFRTQSNISFLNEKDTAYLDKDEVPSDVSPVEIRLRSKMFLCDLARKKKGKWMILIQSGTTHGTMVERIAGVIGKLRYSVGEPTDSISRTEALIGKLQDLTMLRHRAYLREIEAEICDLIEEPLLCPDDLSQSDDRPKLPATVVREPNLEKESSSLTAATGKARTGADLNAIWVRFHSSAGRSYKAIHVFQHPSGPYILLTSKDKDTADFRTVEKIISNAYKGTPEKNITNRMSDICIVIRVPSGFTKEGVTHKVDTFFKNTFSKVAIEAVYYY